MDVIHAQYERTQDGVTTVVSGSEAADAWEACRADRRGGSVAQGFVVWEFTGLDRRMTVVSYQPVSE